MTKRTTTIELRPSLDTPRDVERFRKAAKKYVREATTSTQKARNALVALGIYTPKGNLTKNYK